MLENRIRELHAAGRFPEAATVAIEGYGPEIFSFLRISLCNQADAEDVFGIACIDLWNGICDFRFECTFRTWAYLVARRAQARFTRKESPYRAQDALSAIPYLSELEARVRTATRPYLQSALKSSVLKLREQLAPDEQMLLLLRVDRDLPWLDVARVMATADGVEVNDATLTRVAATYRKQFERTVAKLRHLAEAHGLLSET